MNRIKESISNPKELNPSLARRLEIAKTINEERLRKLYGIEQVTKFRFGVAHLQGLGKITDDQEFFLTAACEAEYRLEGGEVESAFRGMRSAYAFSWFEKLFPECRASQGNGAAQQATTTSIQAEQLEQKNIDGNGQGSDRESSSSPVLEVHEKNVIVIGCPECGCENFAKEKTGTNGQEGTLASSRRILCGRCGRGLAVHVCANGTTDSDTGLREGVWRTGSPRRHGGLTSNCARGSMKRTTLSGLLPARPLALLPMVGTRIRARMEVPTLPPGGSV